MPIQYLLLLKNVLIPKNVKGVMLNMPDVTNLPCLFSRDLVFKNSLLTYNGSPINYYNFEKLLSTSRLDSLLSPKVNISLKPVINSNYPLDPQSY